MPLKTSEKQEMPKDPGARSQSLRHRRDALGLDTPCERDHPYLVNFGCLNRSRSYPVACSLSQIAKSGAEKRNYMKKKTKRAIILRLDEDVVHRVDEVRTPLRMNRSTWLRKAVARNLQYNAERDLPVVACQDVQAALLPECV
jgi:predicted transcriptional regulator